MNKISKPTIMDVVKDMWVVDEVHFNYFDLFEIFCCRKRPDNMTNEAIAEKLKMLLHFRGTGKATDKEYQELSDVIGVGLWLEYFNED